MRTRLLVLVPFSCIVLITSVSGQESSAVFPLGSPLAGDRELPKTYGVGLTYHSQKQDYDLLDLTVNLPGVDLAREELSLLVLVGDPVDQDRLAAQVPSTHDRPPDAQFSAVL